MDLQVTGWLVPRAGSTAAGCEDALWPAPGGSWESRRGREFSAVMADGASEGYLSGLWARLLVETLGQRRELDFEGRLAAARLRWDGEVARLASAREEEGRPLQWFEELGLSRGAGAAVLDFTLHADGHWEAVSVGDVCLFQVGPGDPRVFPRSVLEGFGSTPDLVPTRPLPGAGKKHLARSRWGPGDRFFLATDALAAWILREFQEDREPWGLLERFEPEGADFARWVGLQREAGDLRDDDVALLVIRS